MRRIPKKFRYIVPILVSWVLIFPLVPMYGDDTDLFTAKVSPNVMIIFDTSGSMTFDIWHNYHFYTWGDGSPDYPGRDSNGDGIPNDSRMYNLKQALTNILNMTDGINFAFATYGQKHMWYRAYWYRSYPYGYWNRQYIRWHGYYWPYSYPGPSNIKVLRVPFGDDEQAVKREILKWIDNINQSGDKELRADGGTPIGGTVYWVRRYLLQYVIPYDPAIDCRRYFVLLLTDGEETGYPYHNSHSPWHEIERLRHVVYNRDTIDIMTFVVGVGITGSKQLQEFAEIGGTGHYYPATNPEEMAQALSEIFHLILENSVSFSAPEIPAIVTQYQNKLYLPTFIPSIQPIWKGRLKCYQLDQNGTLPIDPVTGKPAVDPIWDAGEMLKSKRSRDRDIYTAVNGNMVPFRKGYVPASVLDVPEDSVDYLIKYVRGENPYHWKLGDIFHSEPVVIGSPSEFFNDQGYREFRNQNRYRHRVVVVGSNDGMFHAFDAGFYDQYADSFTAGTGDELWAFIPPDLLPKLKKTLVWHQYMVDGTPSVSDIWVPSRYGDNIKDPDEWHTILIFGERQGGRYYTALDVTNTISPAYLWSFTDDEMGQTWSKPAIGRVQISQPGIQGETWIAAFGGGTYDSTMSDAPKGRGFYIVNAYTGNLIWKITYMDGKTNSEYMDSPIPGNPRWVDYDSDGYIDYFYVGDLRGRLWRIDVTSLDPSEWTATPIFISQETQPIYTAPSVTIDPNKNLWIYFGSGNRAEPMDTTQSGVFYAVKDFGQTSPLTESDLADVTFGGHATSNGWYYRLGTGGKNGEKLVSGPDVFAGKVYFTTYQPIISDNPCGVAGDARLYSFNYITGHRYYTELIGKGMPTKPQISVSQSTGVPVLIATTSTGQVITKQLGEPLPLSRLIYWRELKGQQGG